MLGSSIAADKTVFVCVSYLQGCENGGGDNDEEPEVHVEELTDHIGHVGWKDEQKETQRHGSEVLPQTPKKDGQRERRRSAARTQRAGT